MESLYRYLKQDHRKICDLMEQIISMTSPVRRLDLFDELKHAWTLYAETEHATFYAALAHKREIGEDIEHGKKELAEIKDYLAKLSHLSVEHESWIEKFGEFKHAVKRHFEEEEKTIFKKAKKIFSKEQSAQIARDMEVFSQKYVAHAV